MFEKMRELFGLSAYRVAKARNMQLPTLRKQERTVINPKIRDIDFYWRLAQRHGWTAERFLELMIEESRQMRHGYGKRGGKRFLIPRSKSKTSE